MVLLAFIFNRRMRSFVVVALAGAAVVFAVEGRSSWIVAASLATVLGLAQLFVLTKAGRRGRQ